jgi:hypothetical protein
MKDDVSGGGSDKEKSQVIRSGNRRDRVDYCDRHRVNLP